MICEFTCEESIEEFGCWVTLFRYELAWVVHCFEDVGLFTVSRDVSPIMNSGGEDNETRSSACQGCRFAQHWEEQKGQKEGGKDISLKTIKLVSEMRRIRLLPPVTCYAEMMSRNPCILNKDIQSIQFSLNCC